jgi:alpha-amylase
MRNIAFSDDIAFRFGNRSWDKYPLTADRYAQWIAESPGDLVTVFLDYETFGEHFWKETGIFNFLHSLPEELANRDVKTVLPSPAIAAHTPADNVEIRETISWADLEKDTSAWMGNERQQTAFHAVQAARAYAADKQIWRYLLTSDHFYYMASKYGTCGEVHAYFSPHDAETAFCTYMQVLADYEARNVRVMKNRKSAKTLRTLSSEKAFHFACNAGFIGHAAYSLDHFAELLAVVPADSIAYHQDRKDFSRWITAVLEDPKLAESLEGVRERHELIRIVNERRETLWSHLR